MSSSRLPRATPSRSLRKFHGGLALERAGVGLVALADADGIDDDEVGLGARVGAADGLQIGGREHARAAALHLLEVDAAAHVAQEDRGTRAA